MPMKNDFTRFVSLQDRQSVSQRAGDRMRRWLNAPVTECAGDPMRRWPNALVTQCVGDPMCRWPNGPVTQCAGGSMRRWLNAPVTQWVGDPMRRWLNAPVTQCAVPVPAGLTCNRSRQIWRLPSRLASISHKSETSDKQAVLINKKK